jgi:hypothetical protein
MDRLRAVCIALLLAGCSLPGVRPATPAGVAPDSSGEPQAASAPLLYISDSSTGDVFVYNFSTKAPVATLKGFQSPYGQCVDSAGNVWIADLNAGALVQYAHGASKPSRRLRTNGNPIGCAVNGHNGDLAVANYAGRAGAGNIQIWRHGRVPSATYRATKFYYLWPPAYDASGNLFAEAQMLDGPYGLLELPKGGSALRSISLSGATIRYAGGVFWDGQALGVTDQNSADGNTTAIYRVAVKGASGKVIGRIHLTDSCHYDNTDIVEPFPILTNGTTTEIIGGNLWCAHRFGTWNYPAGGPPSSLLPKAPAEPFGESVSPARNARDDRSLGDAR